MNMKFLLAFGSALSVSICSFSALAEFTIDEMHTATASAVANFVKDNPAHADHFTGYKSWKSGDDVKVKVYALHGGTNMEFNYLCHKHGTLIECHFQ